MQAAPHVLAQPGRHLTGPVCAHEFFRHCSAGAYVRTRAACAATPISRHRSVLESQLVAGFLAASGGRRISLRSARRVRGMSAVLGICLDGADSGHSGATSTAVPGGSWEAAWTPRMDAAAPQTGRTRTAFFQP